MNMTAWNTYINAFNAVCRLIDDLDNDYYYHVQLNEKLSDDVRNKADHIYETRMTKLNDERNVLYNNRPR